MSASVNQGLAATASAAMCRVASVCPKSAIRSPKAPSHATVAACDRFSCSLSIRLLLFFLPGSCDPRHTRVRPAPRRADRPPHGAAPRPNVSATPGYAEHPAAALRNPPPAAQGTDRPHQTAANQHHAAPHRAIHDRPMMWALTSRTRSAYSGVTTTSMPASRSRCVPSQWTKHAGSA